MPAALCNTRTICGLCFSTPTDLSCARCSVGSADMSHIPKSGLDDFNAQLAEAKPNEGRMLPGTLILFTILIDSTGCLSFTGPHSSIGFCSLPYIAPLPCSLLQRAVSRGSPEAHCRAGKRHHQEWSWYVSSCLWLVMLSLVSHRRGLPLPSTFQQPQAMRTRWKILLALT